MVRAPILHPIEAKHWSGIQILTKATKMHWICSLLLPHSTDPIALPALTTSRAQLFSAGIYFSDADWLMKAHHLSSQLVFFSIVSYLPPYDSLLLGSNSPTSTHYLSHDPSALSFSGFPVPHLQVLVPNFSLCEQKLTPLACQSVNTGALLITVSSYVNFKEYWTLLHKLMRYSVFRDFCFSNKERSFPPAKSGNRAISETQVLLHGASLGSLM